MSTAFSNLNPLLCLAVFDRDEKDKNHGDHREKEEVKQKKKEIVIPKITDK